MQTAFSFLWTATFVHLKTACSFLIMLLLGWTKGLQHYWLMALLGWPLLPRGNSASPIFWGLAVLSLQDSLQSSTHKGSTRVTHASRRNSASMESQGKEVLSLQDTLHHSTHLNIRCHHCKILRPTHDFLQTHLQEPEFFFGSRVTCFGRDTSRHFKTPTWNFYEEIYEWKWYRKELLIAFLEESREEYLQVSLQADSALTCCHEKRASGTLKNKKTTRKGMLSNQPWLTRITPTALLGNRVLQPFKGMTSLRTDFKKHAKWQGYAEEPTAKDFVARKVHTIEWNKVQGTILNAIKCKGRLRNRPEAVVRQATINLYSRVWKSLGDSFPKLYCFDLAEAYVMQESVSSRIYIRRKVMIQDHLMDECMRNLWQKAEWGKNSGNNSGTRFPLASYFKKTCNVGQKYGGACTTWYLEYKSYKNRIRNWIPMQPRKVQRN